jgi:homoserine O-acetyltransferase/O-succinyltransferase
MEPGIFDQLVLTTTSPRESAWGIAIHTAQRLAIEADPTWRDHSEKAGAKGLKAARAIGMLTYRNYEQFAKTQTDDDHSKVDDFKAASYINYQGDKLVDRFNVYSYWLLTKAMDSHNMARGRGSLEGVLGAIKTRTLVVGISSDFLCPFAEQEFLHKHLHDCKLARIESPYGHDGFLIEGEEIRHHIQAFLSKK